MFTLADADRMFPESHDGSVFSDLHKSVYGYRPRGISFNDLDDFVVEYNRLCDELEENMKEEDRRQARNVQAFEKRLIETQACMGNCSREDAIRIIAQAEGISDEDWEFYGCEMLEYELDIPFGYIIKSVSEQ